MLRVLAGAALAVLFLVVLIVNAPAHLVGYFVPPGQVHMTGFSGTIWDGEASSVALATDQGWLQLGQTRWSLSQLYLLLLSPTLDIESAWGQQRLRTNLRLFPSGDLRLRGLDATFPAALIKRFMPVDLAGDLNLYADELTLSGGMPESGQARLVWRQAFWRGNSGSQPLGDYALEVKIPAPAQGSATVTTLSGPIRVEGGVTFSGRSYAVDATLTSADPIDQELSNALQLMAAPVDGGFHLKFESEI